MYLVQRKAIDPPKLSKHQSEKRNTIPQNLCLKNNAGKKNTAATAAIPILFCVMITVLCRNRTNFVDMRSSSSILVDAFMNSSDIGKLGFAN